MGFIDSLKKPLQEVPRIIINNPNNFHIREFIKKATSHRFVLLFSEGEEKYKLKNADAFYMTDFTSLDDWTYDYYLSLKKHFGDAQLEECKKKLLDPIIGALALLKFGIGNSAIIVGQSINSVVNEAKYLLCKDKETCFPITFSVVNSKQPIIFSDFVLYPNPKEEEVFNTVLLLYKVALKLGIDAKIAIIDPKIRTNNEEKQYVSLFKGADNLKKMFNERASKLPIFFYPSLNIALSEKANVLVFKDAYSSYIFQETISLFGHEQVVGHFIYGLEKPFAVPFLVDNKEFLLKIASLLINLS